MLYLTSDWHLSHENILKYCDRPFHSAEEMNGVLLANALSVLKPSDELKVLGDFSFDPDTFDAYASALESVCTVGWIHGNHDPKRRHDPLADDFRWNKRHYYLCHYPWQTWRPNTVMLHGHCHGSPPPLPGDSRQQWRYDVGCDVWWEDRRYFPVPITAIEQAMADGVHPTKERGVE